MELTKVTRWQYIEAMEETVRAAVKAHKLNREKLEKKFGKMKERLLPEVELEPKTISNKEV